MMPAGEITFPKEGDPAARIWINRAVMDFLLVLNEQRAMFFEVPQSRPGFALIRAGESQPLDLFAGGGEHDDALSRCGFHVASDVGGEPWDADVLFAFSFARGAMLNVARRDPVEFVPSLTADSQQAREAGVRGDSGTMGVAAAAASDRNRGHGEEDSRA